MYREKHSVNPAAESTLNTLAIILHIIGIVVAVGFFILSVYELQSVYSIVDNYSYYDDYSYYEEPSVPFYEYLILFITSLVIYVFGGLLPWAVIKVVVNMSRAVMNVSYDVEDIKTTLEMQSQATHVPPPLQ